MLGQLTFDTSNADAIADGSNIGAWVRAGTDGDLVSSGNGASDNVANTFEGLDVRSFLFGYDTVGDNWDRLQQTAGALKVFIDGGDFTVEVDLDGVYNVSTNPDPDSVGLISHNRTVTPTDADLLHRTTAATPGTLASASLSTAHAMDVNAFMYALDDVNGDAELLSKDNVSNGLNVHLAGSDITLLVSDAALANTAIISTARTLPAANVAAVVVVTPLANRKYLWIFNSFNEKVFIGGATVSAANGFPIFPKMAMELRAGAAVPVNFVGTAGETPDLRILELS